VPASTEEFPAPYVSLVVRALGLVPGDRLLELGCGTGELAAALADRGLAVHAVDRSPAMIDMAIRRHGPDVNWICADVETAAAGLERYNAVIAFETFHLFPNPDHLIHQLGDRLMGQASLGIGWRLAGWEDRHSELIAALFETYGVPFRDWGYWLCPDLPSWIDLRWTAPQTESLTVPTRTSLAQAVKFLSTIDRAASMRAELRDQFARDLTEALGAYVDDASTFSGTSRYGITVTSLGHPR
jgi:SAM-dependent methyltransferase